jgi:hypothetical protein
LLGEQGLLRKLGSTVLLVTHSVRHLALADEIVVLGAGGKLLAKGNYRALQSAGQLSEDILQQMQTKKEHKEDSVAPDIVAKVAGPSKEQMEDLTRRVGDSTIYKYYAKSVGWRPIALFLGFAVASAFGQSFSQVWLGWFTKADGHRTAFWLTGYAIIHTATLCFRLGYLWACIIKMYGASAKTLHITLLDTVFGATQAFFTTTDTGITLNRFSQDLIVVDKDMISGVISAGSGFFQVIAMAGLVFASSTYMATVLPLLVLVLYFLTDIYLKTSRQLRFHDLESKSPLYTHFLETLEVSLHFHCIVLEIGEENVVSPNSITVRACCSPSETYELLTLHCLRTKLTIWKGSRGHSRVRMATRSYQEQPGILGSQSKAILPAAVCPTLARNELEPHGDCVGNDTHDSSFTAQVNIKRWSSCYRVDQCHVLHRCALSMYTSFHSTGDLPWGYSQDTELCKNHDL